MPTPLTPHSPAKDAPQARDRWRAIVTAAVLTVPLLAINSPLPDHTDIVPVAGGASVAAPKSGVTASPLSGTVALITGDQVRYAERQGTRPRVQIDPAPRQGKSAPTFTTIQNLRPDGGEDVYVFPSDADPYLEAGTLDRELFNVTRLLHEKRGDSDAAHLPVIVTYRGAPSAAELTRRAEALPGSDRTLTLPSVRGAALMVERKRAGAFWNAIEPEAAAGRSSGRLDRRLAEVSLDGQVSASLDVSVPQIGAPAAWRAGYDGEGATIAVLDTGADAEHPDLKGKIDAAADFTDNGSAADGHGHGTHVASIAVGSGAASGGRYRGVAPGAQLLAGKVLDDDGFGLDSWVIAGMQWATRNGADVVNLSLGGAATDGTDPLSQAVNRLTTETGALFVVAAGNDGEVTSVNSPGAADAALTVGAVDDQDELAPFSSRGPRLADGAVKPNIVAPGVGIVAARAAGTQLGNPVGEDYVVLSGTSMATPHVAGAAAIMAQRHPQWRADDLRDALASSAADVGYRWHEQGNGRVNLARAIGKRVYGPAAANPGRIDPPEMGTAEHEVRRTLTYTNHEAEPVTLDLDLQIKGWNGRQPADGAVQLSAAALTVPAGGQASAHLLIDPYAGLDGVYGGLVVAASADERVRLRTAVGFYAPPETATLTIRVADPQGRPAARPTRVTVLDGRFDPATTNDPFGSAVYHGLAVGGVATVEVREGGSYSAIASLSEHGLTARRTDVLLSPERIVDDDAELALDARAGIPARLRAPQGLEVLFSSVEVVRTVSGGTVSALTAGRTPAGSEVYVTPSEPPERGHLDTYDKWTLRDQALQMNVQSLRQGGAGPHTPALHPVYDPYPTTTKLPAADTVSLVAVGAGTADDFADIDVRGKLALVRISAPDDVPNPVFHAWVAANQATQRAAQHDALGVVVYVDTPGALPLNMLRSEPIAQLALSQAEGAALARRAETGPVPIRLRAQPTPTAMYHLYHPHSGAPAEHDHGVGPAGMARMLSVHHASRSLRYERNWFAFGGRSLGGMREQVQFPAPASWIDYVGPTNADVEWERWTTQYEQTSDRTLLTTSLISRDDRYLPGTAQLPAEEWFKAPLTEGLPDDQDGLPCGLCRGGPDGDLFIPAWFLRDSDPRHYVQSWPEYQSTVRLFRNGAELPASPPTLSLPFPTFRLAAEPGVYRLHVDGPTPGSPHIRPPEQRTRTVWTFHSRRPGDAGRQRCPGALGNTCAYQPLIDLRYDVPLNPDSAAPANRAFSFRVDPDSHPATVGLGEIEELRLWYSVDDGRTWRPGLVSRHGDGYRVTVHHPALSDTTGSVWLRTQAWDSRNNRVDQTVRSAYRLTDSARAG